MEEKIYNILVKYSSLSDFYVEITSQLDENESYVKKVEKDKKTDEFLHLNCAKCNENIRINLYFYKTDSQTNKIEEKYFELESSEVKFEPDILIKEEELEITDDSTEFESESDKELSFKSKKLKTLRKIKRNFNKKVKIPKGVVLPDLTKLETPFYICVDQPNGSKVWVEKTKTIKGFRISNFDSRLLKCDLCGFEAKHRSLQIRHRKMHLFQLENDTTCLGCRKNFLSSEERITHAYFCPEKDTVNVLACAYCDFIATSYLKLRQHIGATHGPKKDRYRGTYLVMCHICSKEIRRCKMYGHLLTHSVPDGKPFFCNHCDKKFSSRNALKTHLIKFHFKDSAKFSCHLCPLVFKGRQEFDKHLFSRHRIGKSPAVTCTICSKTLANDSSLSSHMISQHKDASEKPKFECSYPKCGKFFFKKTNLENHFPTHLPESERPHKCWCGRGFATRDKLNRHDLEHTDPNKLLHMCNVCGKAMKSKQSLKVHLRIHTGEQPYNCNLCTKKFADRGNYRVHMKQHEKELGLKLTFTTEERRLMKLNVLKPDQMLENPGRSGVDEINQSYSKN